MTSSNHSLHGRPLRDFPLIRENRTCLISLVSSIPEPETRQDLAESLRLVLLSEILLRFASPRNFRGALAFTNFLSFSIVFYTTVR